MSAHDAARPTRTAPLEAWYRSRESATRTIEEMAVPSGFGQAPAAAAVRLCDRSWRRRFGCKGPAAEAWLTATGFKVPAPANTAHLDAAGVLVARLATSEFLIEAFDGGGASVAAAAAVLGSAAGPAGVYPVARQDLVLEIAGRRMQELLRQICGVDFEPLLDSGPGPESPVVLTSMVGVGVVAWPSAGRGAPRLTLWSDPSFAHYFWTTLLEVGGDLAGGVAVIDPGSDSKAGA